MKKLNRFKESKFYGWLDFLAKNAMFLLFLTLILFAIDQYNNTIQQKDVIKSLKEIQESASTRFLGRFPDYLKEVNNVLETAKEDEEVIVFEDVLYYGILSEPREFKKLNHVLLKRANEGYKVTIAYYDVDSIAFHLMLVDNLIGEMRARGVVTDSTLQEQCFRAKRDKNESEFRKFENKVKKYRKPVQGKPKKPLIGHKRKLMEELENDPLVQEFEALYGRLDSIKTYYMGKKIKDITFSDFKKMYQGMSREISALYSKHNIELIPLKDYLTMSCWMVGDRAVIAFPSRYSTDEIGFFSQDKAFYDYIHTMLQGVRSQNLSYSSSTSH